MAFSHFFFLFFFFYGKQQTKETTDYQLVTNPSIIPPVKQTLFSATFQKKKTNEAS
jgi:hypothetical protein